ncbi:Histone acetyltransferase [Brettanomyces nanus]|uniref:Histone acetyltransferase ESA1 n=1 Tax=Eeniella nana TaxID=13502 RepID=A0A875RTH1_EENNA|nr:Histone acetyltransferase [Brettanomyces nanus]QPG73487.1 Histone acetyltransferase [Brettanomyces nanus]
MISGCQVYVNKNGKYQLAEVLGNQVQKDETVYYVHYVLYNKRLDELISLDKIDFHRPMYPPKPAERKEKRHKKKSKKRNNDVKKNTRSTTADKSLKEDEVDLDNLNVQGIIKDGEKMSRTDELEKLRTSGSMMQSDVHALARMRNFNKVYIGNHEVEPWYFSPYPVEYTEDGVLYIDDFSLKYFSSKKQFERFRMKCTLRHPPGNEVYRDSYVSFFEIDGKKQRTWCRNLCLLSKLFLDHKTLYYDVDPFLFYCMTRRDEYGYHLVGYFSKEKESTDSYNVACILTLPQYQRHGFGKLLIQFSYELSKKEGKVGSPEKPLSDLGLLSYRAYWTETLVTLLIENKLTDVSIDEISQMTSMTTTDILHTLQTLNMLKYYKGQHIICVSDQVSSAYDKLHKKKKHKLDSTKLIWKPPVFTAAQLRFGW